MRRAFTLLEILAVVGIIGIIATLAFAGVNTGTAAARLRGATRGVFATVRQARSVAIVSQKPAVVTYSNSTADGEPCISVRLDTVKLMDTAGGRVVHTLEGDEIDLDDPTGAVAAAKAEATRLASMRGESVEDAVAAISESSGSGESIEDILFAPIDASVMGGMMIKVVVGDEAMGNMSGGDVVPQRRVSVFSNVDRLLGNYKKADEGNVQKEEEKPDEEDAFGQESSFVGEVPPPYDRAPFLPYQIL